MKKYISLAALLVAGAAFANADTITLDSGGSASLYQDIIDGTTEWGSGNSGTYTPSLGATFTIYVEVKDLFGATALSDDKTYSLDSFSFIGNGYGHYSDPTRTWTISTLGGSDFVTCEQDKATNKFHTTDFTTKATGSDPFFTFQKNDILTFTLTPPADGYVSVMYYDYNTPGVSFTLADGEVNDGINHMLNPGTTSWKYNSPAIRLTATAIPEPSAFGLLAGLGALALVGARRRRR